LSLRAGAERTTASFAGDGRAGWRSWSALLWGADPNHYYDRTSWNVGARWQREGGAPWLDAGWTQARELPLAVHQRWNVLGRTLSPAGMREADAVDIGTAHVTAGVRWGALTLRGGVAAHRMQMRFAGWVMMSCTSVHGTGRRGGSSPTRWATAGRCAPVGAGLMGRRRCSTGCGWGTGSRGRPVVSWRRPGR
jgi:hypothetical protein